MKDDKFEKCLLIKPSIKKDETSYADEILIKIAEILSFNDRKIIKKLELILENFSIHLKNKIHCFVNYLRLVRL